MRESELYFLYRNLLIKFDGLYWYWSPAEGGWILEKNLAKVDRNISDFIYLSEKEAKKFIKNNPFP
ncbi:MAG: hypothetical protein WC294_07335 [Methanoregula sp.]